MKAENKLLGKLLDRFERAELRAGDSNRAITEKINKKSLPIYFSEKDVEFENINERLISLEKAGAIEITWRGRRKGHIIEKIKLGDEKVLYSYLNRAPLLSQYSELKRQAVFLKEKYGESKLVELYIDDLLNRLEENKSCKKLVDINDLEGFSRFVKLLYYIDLNEEACFMREFSVKHFSDSKFFDKHKRKLISTIKAYYPEYEESEDDQILGEFFIYPNPAYLYIKGDGILKIGENTFDLSALKHGIAISEEDLVKVSFEDLSEVKKVITIENLTSFYRFSEKNTINIYTGGFHNRVHREFLKRLYTNKPDAEYRHFGDIDIGGFRILLDLIKKTGISFRAQDMDSSTLKEYLEYSKDLTKVDRSRLNHLIANLEDEEVTGFLDKTDRDNYLETLKTVKSLGKKLEQEALFWSKEIKS